MRIAKDTLPACPACARPMRPIAESVAASPPQTYRCGRCQVLFHEAIRATGQPDRAMNLNFNSLATMH
jgi:hypothetical protein